MAVRFSPVWVILGVLRGAALGLGACPVVPIMPDAFDFKREMFTFWATETVWNERQFFSKIEQRPSFSLSGRAILFMPGLGVVGSSSESRCLPWNYCDFYVYDCNDVLVYKGEVMTLQSTRNPDQQVTAIKLTDKDGNLLGRTTELPSLLPRLGGIAEKSESEVVLLDTGGSVVMELKKDPNQIWVTHWTGALDAPGMSGFDGVHSVPLADPLLITFFISNQFRSKGLFSPFTDLILWTLFTGVLVYLIWKWRSGAITCFKDDDFLDARDLKEFSDRVTLLEGGCCSRPRPKY